MRHRLARIWITPLLCALLAGANVGCGASTTSDQTIDEGTGTPTAEETTPSPPPSAGSPVRIPSPFAPGTVGTIELVNDHVPAGPPTAMDDIEVVVEEGGDGDAHFVVEVDGDPVARLKRLSPGDKATIDVIAESEPDDRQLYTVTLTIYTYEDDGSGSTKRRDQPLAEYTYEYQYVVSTPPSFPPIAFQRRAFTRDGSGGILDWDDQIALVGFDAQAPADTQPPDFFRQQDPSWAPDGTRIVYCGTWSYDADLFVHDLVSDTWSQLTDVASKDWSVLQPDWCPADPDTIACGLYTFDNSALRDRWWIGLVDATTGDITDLTDPDDDSTWPSWSPDGFQIAFLRNGQIWRVRADGTTSPQRIYTHAYGWASTPAWSPSGGQIAFAGATADDPTYDRIWLLNLSLGTARQLTKDAGSFWDTEPAWTPDGNTIVFTRYPDSDPARTVLCSIAVGSTGGHATELAGMSGFGNDDAATDADISPK